MIQSQHRTVPVSAIGLYKRTREGKAGRIVNAHARSTWKKGLFLLLLAAGLILASCVIITLGKVPITVADVYRTVINQFIPGLFPVSRQMAHVIWKIRIPLILGALLAGGGLGICGCAMQTVLKNPLASPFTLGISAGAHLGVSIAAVLSFTILRGPYFLVGNAFLCALICSIFIIALSYFKGASSETLVLAGVAVTYLFQAINELFQYVATEEQRTVMSLWGMGSLANLNWNSIWFLGAVFAVCVPLLYWKAWDFNLMTAGDESAKSMGVNANQVRIFVMTVASLLVASIVAFIGVIGFIGLVAPHIGRMILGSDHRYLIPAAGGLGAAILLITNAVAMNLFGHVAVPTGIIMSIISVPFFMFLILRRKRKEFWS
jgi:iron complex transport system permease protein